MTNKKEEKLLLVISKLFKKFERRKVFLVHLKFSLPWESFIFSRQWHENDTTANKLKCGRKLVTPLSFYPKKPLTKNPKNFFGILRHILDDRSRLTLVNKVCFPGPVCFQILKKVCVQIIKKKLSSPSAPPRPPRARTHARTLLTSCSQRRKGRHVAVRHILCARNIGHFTVTWSWIVSNLTQEI